MINQSHFKCYLGSVLIPVFYSRGDILGNGESGDAPHSFVTMSLTVFPIPNINATNCMILNCCEALDDENNELCYSQLILQPADIGWPTGNG